MKLQYLGTAAAEGIPGVFCECEVCRHAREHGGQEIRTRSQSLLDDTVLIDLPADTYLHALRFGLHLSKIHTLIITHAHSDHLYPAEFWCRNPGIANEIDSTPLHVYVTHAGYEKCNELIDGDTVSRDRVVMHEITPFTPFEAEGYRFTPLKADHDAKADPVTYLIEKDGKAMLYAHDTGFFPQETWDYLAGWGGHFDFVSLDCTNVFLDYRQGHMGLLACKDAYDKLCELGLCDKDTVACLNHFSHNGMENQTRFVEEAEKLGFLVSYDGRTIEF